MHFHNFHNERYIELHSQLCLSNYMALVIIVTFKNANNVAKANAMSKSTENHTSTAYRTFLVNCNWKSHILPVSFARRTFSTMLGMSFKSRSSTELSVVSPYGSRELNQRLFSKSVQFSCMNNILQDNQTPDISTDNVMFSHYNSTTNLNICTIKYIQSKIYNQKVKIKIAILQSSLR